MMLIHGFFTQVNEKELLFVWLSLKFLLILLLKSSVVS